MQPCQAASTRTRPRVLVIAEGGMGDTILAVPVLRALRRALPDAHITVNCGRAWTELFKECPYTDAILSAPRQPGQWRMRLQRLWATVSFGLSLRGAFDIVLVVYPATRQLHLVAWLTGARHRISYDRGGPDFLLTGRLPNDGTARELNIGLLPLLGAERADPSLELWPTSASASRVQHMLSRVEPGADQLLIGLHPGSDWSCQQWQPAKWAALADMLARVYRARVVLTGSAEDRTFLDEVRAIAKTDLLDLGGQTTLTELVALTSRFDLLVSVDSGPAPIALAVGTPVVVLVGEFPPDWTVSGFHDAVRVVRRGNDAVGEDVRLCRDMHYGVDRCITPTCLTRGRMHLIQVTDVLAAVQQLYTEWLATKRCRKQEATRLKVLG